MRLIAIAASAVLLLTIMVVSADIERTEEISPGRSEGPTYIPLSDAWCSITGHSQYIESGGFTRGVGDVNGDGFDDVVISAWRAGVNGEVYLVFGRGAGMPDGDPLTVADVKFTGESGSLCLGSASGAGDVNGDGFDDILMGDSGFSSGGIMERGKAYLFFGRSGGWRSHYNISEASASWLGERTDDSAGFLATGVGDVNNDTYDDLVIGAGWYDSVENDTGKFYLIFGGPMGWSRNVVLDNTFISFYGEKEDQFVGRPGTVVGVGDVDGDGIDDMMVGGFDYSQGTRDYIDISYLLLGRNNGWSRNASIAENCDASFLGDEVLDCSALVGGGGDVNGDGLNDILISGFRTNEGKGSVYLFHGKKTGWKRNTSVLSADIIYNCSQQYRMGESISILGDVDLDGYDDIAIGAPEMSHNNADEGGVYIIKGNSSAWEGSIDVDEAADIVYYGEFQDHTAGGVNEMGWVGDVNGDGYNDIQIGSREYWTSELRRSGKTYVCLINRAKEQAVTDSVKLYGDPNYTSEVRKAIIGERVFVELNGTDGNSSHRDQAFVNVRTIGQDFFLPLMLSETGINTGRYIGNFTVGGVMDTLKRHHDSNPWTTIRVYAVRNPNKNSTLYIEDWVDVQVDGLIGIVNESQLYTVSFFNKGISTPEIWSVDLGFADDWLEWNRDDLTLSGVPLNQHVGTYSISVNVSDDVGHFDEISYELEVRNLPPKIITEPPISVNETESYFVDMDCDQEGQGEISWSFTKAPFFLSIDGGTGEITGVPPKGTIGNFSINVSVNDGNGGWDHLDFLLFVEDVNEAPKILSADLMEAVEDDLYFSRYRFSDGDPDDDHGWTMVTNSSWLFLDPLKGELKGVPRNKDVGNCFVNLTLSDNRGGYDFRNFTITVQNTNDAPYWVDVCTGETIEQGARFNYIFSAVDPDVGDTVEYNVDSIPESDVEIDPITGIIDWLPVTEGMIPTESGSFVFTLIVSATDGVLVTNHEFPLDILRDPSPSSILIYPKNGVSLPRSDIYLQWNGSDPDDDAVHYELYFGIDRGKVANLDGSIRVQVPLNATAFYPEDLEQGRDYYWTVIPRDIFSSGICISGVFDFHVNTPPELERPTDQVIDVGKRLNLVLKGNDNDARDRDMLTYSVMDGPEGLVLDGSTGALTWGPGIDDVGIHVVTVLLSDGKEETNVSFNITVNATIQITEEEKKEKEDGFPFLLLIIISIVVLSLLTLVILIYIRKRKGPEDFSEEQPGNLDNEGEEVSPGIGPAEEESDPDSSDQNMDMNSRATDLYQS